MEDLTSEDLRILRQQLELKSRELAEKEARLQQKEVILDEEKRNVERQIESIQATIDHEEIEKVEVEQNKKLKHLIDIINEQQNANRTMQANLDKILGEFKVNKTERPSSQAAMFTNDVWGEPSGYNPPASTPQREERNRRSENPYPQGSNYNQRNLPNIKYKDALESVPIFTGSNIPVLRFVRSCQKILNLFGPNHEASLLLLLKNKLKGNAQTALEDDMSLTIREFTDRLKSTFGSSKSVNEYRGELGSIIKFPSENAIQYIARVKDLHFAILEMDSEIWGPLSSEHQSQCESDTIDSFIKGLPPDFRIRVQQLHFKDLEDLFAKTIATEKEIIKDQRFQKLSNPSFPQRNIRAAFASKDPCKHCNKPGHDPENCWTAFPDKRPKGNNDRYNRPGGGFNRNNNNNFNQNDNGNNFNRNNHNNYSNQNNNGNNFNRNNNNNFNRNNNNNNFNRNNDNNRNNYNDNRSKSHCSYCDKIGHVEDRCFKRIADLPKNVKPLPTEEGPLGEQKSSPVKIIEIDLDEASTSA